MDSEKIQDTLNKLRSAVKAAEDAVYVKEIREGTKPGYTEVVFSAKPSDEIREVMKLSGYRWSSYNQVWYGLTVNLPEICNDLYSCK